MTHEEGLSGGLLREKSDTLWAIAADAAPRHSGSALSRSLRYVSAIRRVSTIAERGR